VVLAGRSRGRRGDETSGWRRERDVMAGLLDGDTTAADCPEDDDDCDAGLPLF